MLMNPGYRIPAGTSGSVGCECLAIAFFLAALAMAAVASDDKQPKPGRAELREAIERIDALIAEKRRTSLTFRLRGRLGGYDFGHPPISWSMARRLSTNPASRYFRTLMFFAVCRENGRALHFLFAVNNDVSGGFFLIDEVEYLHWIALRHGLDLDFRGAYRRDKGPPPDDLRSINHRRRVAAALEAGRPREALRLVTRFAQLCRAG